MVSEKAIQEGLLVVHAGRESIKLGHSLTITDYAVHEGMDVFDVATFRSNSGPNMIKDIRHTGIVVMNLESSLHFYRDLLGFQTIREMEEAGNYLDNISSLRNVKVTTVKLTLPSGPMIELLKYHSHPTEQKTREICEIGISHIAFTVDNLDIEYKRLKDKEIKFNSPPQLSPDGYAKVTFCMAPEGTLIELVEVL